MGLDQTLNIIVGQVFETAMSSLMIILALFCLIGVSIFAEEQTNENPKEEEAEEKHFGLSTMELTQLIEQEKDVATLLLHHIENSRKSKGIPVYEAYMLMHKILKI